MGHTDSSAEPPESHPVEGVGDVPPSPLRRRLPHLRRASGPARVHTLDALRNRSFRMLWGAVFWSGAAGWLQQVTLGWLTYDLTGSALLTSVVMGLDALTLLLLGPVGGFLADVMDRRVLLVRVYAAFGLLALAFAIGVGSGHVGAAHIFAFTLLSGTLAAASEPARVSLTARLVPREGLVNAFALISLAFSATRVGAPALGGLMIAAWGPEAALYAQAGCYFAAASLALGMRFENSSGSGTRLSEAFAGLAEAARFVARERIIVVMLLFATLPALTLMPFTVGLVPVYAARVFSVGPAGLGLLLSAPGLGQIMGGTAMASIGNVPYKGRVVVVSCIVAAVAMVGFSRTESYPVAFATLVVALGCLGVIFTMIQAAVHSLVRDELRGRVSGLMMAAWGVLPVGSVLAGLLAERWGAPMATLVGAGILTAATVLLAAWFREVWRLK